MALKRPSLRAWVVGALVVALAFTTTLAVREWHRADHTQSRLSDRLTQMQNARAAAGALAVALYHYDYRNLAQAQRDIQRFATGGFAQREASQAAAVQAQLRKAKAVSTAGITETTVSDLDGDQATAFVVLRTSASSNGGKPLTNIVYLHVHLQRVGAVWKVDDVQNLQAAG